MADSDRQTDERGDQNLRKKGEEKEKGNKNELTLSKMSDRAVL